MSAQKGNFVGLNNLSDKKSTGLDHNQIFIGRQPIFDSKLNVIGYELLYRAGDMEVAGTFDGNNATAQVIKKLLLEYGLDKLVGNKYAYINFPYDLLINGSVEVLPKDQVVIEILEDITVDNDLIKAVKSLANKGYLFALDDFVYHEKFEPLTTIANIIKIDVMSLSRDEIKEQINYLHSLKTLLLAEKVETQDEFNEYREMGFDYFQGYFFSKPEVVSTKALPENNQAIIRLIASLNKPTTDIKDVEELVSQNISLSYKLLRYLNSAYFSLPRKIDSISEAVIYFGLDLLKQWASIIAMSCVENKSPELIQNGLIRAKMCESLAEALGIEQSDSYFITGLFSIMEALFDYPMDKILSEMPLSNDIKKALVNKEGHMANILKCSIAYEECKWSDAELINLDENIINEIYINSIEWAKQIS